MAEVYLGVGIDASGAQQGAAQYDNAAKKVTEGAKKATKENEALTKQIKEAQKVIQLQQKQLDSVGGALDQYKMALGQARLAVSQKQKQIDSIKQALMQYENALRTAEKAVRDQGKEIESLKQKLEDSNNKIKESQKTWEGYKSQINNTLLVVKAFAAATAALAVREISNFTQELSNARAMTNASTEDMVRLEKVVRELGASTSFSSSQTAAAAAELGKAGFSVDQIISTLPATLDLAAAATIGIAEASKITANVMAGFGISASESGKAADILAAIATNASTDISGMGDAIKYVGPVAKSVGWTLGETAVLIGALANAGIEGSMAGTGLKATISSLVSPSASARRAIAEMGLTVDQVNPKLVKGDEVVRRLASAGLDAEKAFQIFGERGAVAILALTDKIPNIEKLSGVVDKADNSARRMSTIKLANLAGDFEKLTGELSESALQLGDLGLTGAIRGFLQESTKWIESLNQTFEAISKNKEAAALFSDVMLGLALTIGGVIVLKLAEWAYGAAAAFAAAGVAAGAFTSALVLLTGGATIGALAYLAKLRMETIDLEAETRKQEEALLDLPGAYGTAARAGRVHMLELQLATMRTTDQIKQDIKALETVMGDAEKRMNIARNRFPGGAPAGMEDSGSMANLAGQADTARISQATAELKRRADIEAEIAELKNTQYYWSAMANKEVRDGLRGATDYADKITKGMLGLAGGFSVGPLPKGESATTPPATVSQAAGATRAEKPVKSSPYDTDGIMSFAFSQMAVLKQESDKAIEVFKQQEMAKEKYMQGLEKQSQAEQKRLELTKQYGDNVAEIDTQMQLYNATREHGLVVGSEEYLQAERLIKAQKDSAASTKELEEARRKELDATKKAEEAHKQWANSMTYAFKDAIMNSKNLGDALSNLANRVQDMLVNKALDSLLGGFFGGFSKGAAFQAGGVTAFASGGVVSQPSFFPMSGNRTGLMGEAGPEAIMPLTRTSSGDLGVRAVGTGGTTVIAPVVNISVSGGSEEQNQDAATKVSAAVRDAIDDVVMNVLLREKRPGGSLT